MIGGSLGGLRLPAIAAPAATYGVGQGDPCFLFGYEVPFSAQKMQERYRTPKEYVSAVNKSANELVQQKWLRPAAVNVLVTEAKTAAF